MPNLEDVLLVEAVAQPEWEGDEKELEKDIEKMFLANKYASRFYDHLKQGTLTKGFCEEFADVLCECDINPYQWLDNTQNNVRLILNAGISYTI